MKKNKISLAGFLTGLIIIVFCVFMLISSISFIAVYRESLKDSATLSAEQTVSIISETLDMNLNNLINDYNLVIDRLESYKSSEDAGRYLSSVASMRSGVTTLLLYDEEGNILECDAREGEMKEDIDNNLSFQPELFNSRVASISAPHVQNIFKNTYPWVVSIGGKINSRAYGGEVYLILDVSFTSLLDYVNSVSIGQRGYCFIINDEGGYVYHPQQQLVMTGIKDEDLNDIKNLASGTVMTKEKIYSVANLSSYGWKVVGISYIDEMINEKISTVYMSIIWIAIVCIAVLIIAITIITNKVSKPVSDLTKAMNEFENEVESFKYNSVKGVNEIQSLSNSFEHMVTMIQKLMVQIKNDENNLRKTELKALQSQINPHFLYNTLDSIQWMCEQKKSDKAIEMVSALAKLFRISISKGKEFIPIEKEIEHVRNYLIIQSFRYSNGFEYRFDVDESIYEYYCNKITLQPIVENAIIHGVGDMCDEGMIVISAKKYGDKIEFKISDNGVGMTEDKCRKILLHDASDNFGIGIKNVYDRLKIYFGDNADMRIESELDEGTTITITFPAVTEEYLKKEGLR